ncbi:hypothetical protein [Crocosphaera sp.]|uniref:hypothetical protein n=1 Tax=Crocosphaera sp. TaxID=2729996 RepID=UPI00260A1986|nr:hypothetical protein [Crocosphaera sp.]MDJ0580251.1 hypothetical protein [Crocosphaera sp.]
MKIIPSVLITVSVLLVAPNAVGQVRRSSDFNTLATTSSEDLGRVESRSIEDWPWAFGPSIEPIPGLTPYPLRPDPTISLDEIKRRNLNEAYQDVDNQLGDYQRPTYRSPVVDF